MQVIRKGERFGEGIRCLGPWTWDPGRKPQEVRKTADLRLAGEGARTGPGTRRIPVPCLEWTLAVPSKSCAWK
ncbi:Hypothetical predicted protein [Marmota monax]|uniref:Uncharacterized protein n=1 Tax=Marmota monax TaxID=9995 RepID=A0A5E4A495_MARMO|nr:Hypothetical predicted protein [Marmota monax]